MQLPEEFLLLAELFKNNGYDLYLVGGSSRDFLLEQEIEDFDLATNATISQMEQFLSFKTTYPKLSSGNLYFHKKKFDITTLRKEEEYEDYRHPSKIKFTTSLYEDSLRRDFTLNAIYIDDKNYIYDYHGGLNDLNKKILRMIGNPLPRLKEDPLRILRCLRFAYVYHFQIEDRLNEIIKGNYFLVKKLKLKKCLDEINKCPDSSFRNFLNQYDINHIIPYTTFSVDDYHVELLTKEVDFISLHSSQVGLVFYLGQITSDQENLYQVIHSYNDFINNFNSNVISVIEVANYAEKVHDNLFIYVEDINSLEIPLDINKIYLIKLHSPEEILKVKELNIHGIFLDDDLSSKNFLDKEDLNLKKLANKNVLKKYLKKIYK